MRPNLTMDYSELQEVAEIIQQGIFLIDKDKRIIYCNAYVLGLLGYQREELQGINITSFIHTKNIYACSEKNEEKQEEISVTTKFGKEIFVTVICHAISGSDKHIILISDVTKKVEGREKLLQKINTSEKLAHSRYIRDGNLAEAINEIIKETAEAIEVERVNAWLIDNNFEQLECIGNYNHKRKEFGNLITLSRKDIPQYFILLETKEIIISNDALHDAATAELVDIYLSVHGITAMMDVPIRIEGEMVGVVCFEYTGGPRTWTLVDRKFGLFVAQMISLALETHHKRMTQKKLEHTLKEKNLLLSELNHRVKNNLSMVSSLLSLQQQKSKDDFHHELFTESRNRIYSIASLHEMLYQSRDFEHVDLSAYLGGIVELLERSYRQPGINIEVVQKVQPVLLDINKAITLGLIINEIISNSYKHAFTGRKSGIIEIKLYKENDHFVLDINDNGQGIKDYTLARSKGTLGLSLIDDLARQLDAEIHYNAAHGNHYRLQFN